MFYDSTKNYTDKEQAFTQFILPIISSYFRVLEKIYYDFDNDILHIEGDNMIIKFENGKGNVKKKGGLNENDKRVLKLIRSLVTNWENYIIKNRRNKNE
jgi:hypothetical protein